MKTLFSFMFLFIAVSMFGQEKHPYNYDSPLARPVEFEIPGFDPIWHFAFAPNGQTFYFLSDSLYSSTYLNGSWTTPRVMDFARRLGFLETPFISQDGSKFFLTTDSMIVMDKKEDGWGDPKRIPDTVTTSFSWYPTTASNGNLYFLSNRSGQNRIYCSKWINDKYEAPKKIEINVVDGGDIISAFVSQDETFIIMNIYRTVGIMNVSDIFVSFKRDTSWTYPKSLGSKINDPFNFEDRPSISPDSKYLFYIIDANQSRRVYQYDWKPLYDSLKISDYPPHLAKAISTIFYKPGTELNFKLEKNTFLDDDVSDSLSYSAKMQDGLNLPSWLTFDPVSLTLKGTNNTEQLLRMQIIATDKSGSTAIAAFMVMPEGYSSNIARNKPTSASSEESGETPADYAVDSLLYTRWSSAFSEPQWLKIDLQGIYSVAGVEMIWEAAYATAFSIEVSLDNSTWTTVYSTLAGDGEQDIINFDGVEARYIRVYGTQRSSPWGISLWDFKAYGKYLRQPPLALKSVSANLQLELYPNPVSTHAKINYGLSAKSFVELVITDMSGRTIQSVISENQDAGEYSLNFDAGILRSGVYFCKLNVGNIQDIKKFVIVK